MSFTTRYSGTISYVETRWPTFIIGYGGGILMLIIVLFLSINQGWLAFINLAVAGTLVLVYFLVASLWAAHQLYAEQEIIDAVFALGEIDREQTMVYIDLGLRSNPIAVSRRLSSGRVIVMDVYNPQLAPARWLSRATSQAEHPLEDPRIEWKGGSINLLPLPDGKVPAVLLIQTASEFWEDGDRRQLFREIYRVLLPGGFLILVERVRTPTNWLVMGPGAFRICTETYWRNELAAVGFRIADESEHKDLLHLFRAERTI